MSFSHLVESKVTSPELPDDFLVREECNAFLSEAIENHHVLIQSPSGYGKSALAKYFVSTRKLPFSWLSLSEYENEIFQLIEYLCFSCSKANIPFNKTNSFLRSGQLTDEKLLVEQFLSEWLNNRREFLLVLDDVHLIKSENCRNLILKLIETAPKNARLILVSRTEFVADRWKNLVRLKVLNQDKLKFSKEEFRKYSKLNTSLDHSVDAYEEGWITGIKLHQFSTEQENAEQLILRAIRNFSEPAHVLFLAQLEHFNEELIKEVLGSVDLIYKLSKSPLILVKIENGSRNYRFHHFVQEIILSTSTKEIEKHVLPYQHTCIDYFLVQNKTRLAFELALKNGNQKLILETFKRYRLECFNKTKFQALRQALELIVQNTAIKSNAIELTKAWIEIIKGSTANMISRINGLEETDFDNNLKSEYWVLKAYVYYIQGNPEEALKATETANSFGFENYYAQGYIYIFRLGSLHSLGKAKQAYSEGIESLSLTYNPIVKTQILLVLCYISRFEARAQNQFDYANALIKLSNKSNNLEGLVNGQCFLAEYYYNRGELKRAERLLQHAFEFKDHTIGVIGMSITWLYSKTLLEIGKTTKAQAILRDEIERLTIAGNAFLLPFFKGMRAQLKCDTRHVSEINEWANTMQIDPNLPITEAYSPVFTKLLSETLIGEAHAEIFKKLNTALSLGNYKRALTESQIILTLMRIKQGLIDEAKVELQKALSTLPIKDFKQIYQNYFAYSSALKQLIENLNSPKTNLVFSNRVKLTNRETDIVELFRDRLTDKDIALKLGISLSTVKRHNINIFNKLQVSSKQQALEVLSKM